MLKKYKVLLAAQLLALSTYAPLFAMRQEDQVAPDASPAYQQSKQIAGQEEKEGQEKELTTEERLQRIEKHSSLGRWLWMVFARNGKDEKSSEDLSVVDRLKNCEAALDSKRDFSPRPPTKRLERLEIELGIWDF